MNFVVIFYNFIIIDQSDYSKAILVHAKKLWQWNK